MLRADRNAAVAAGLICAPRDIKGVGTIDGLKGKAGNVLKQSDFDVFNRDPEPEKELTPEDFMRVLSRKG